MAKVKVGQMAIFIWREACKNAEWEYLVAKNVFDGMADFRGKNGRVYMHVFEDHELDSNKIFSNQTPTSTFTLLYNDDMPVFSKKKLFGDFTFEPKTV